MASKSPEADSQEGPQTIAHGLRIAVPASSERLGFKASGPTDLNLKAFSSTGPGPAPLGHMAPSTAATGTLNAETMHGESLIPSDTVSSSFFHLPLDLRHKIYKLCFIQSHKDIVDVGVEDGLIHPDYLLPLALVLTNRQMKAEITQIYFETVVARVFARELGITRWGNRWEKQFHIKSPYNERLARLVLCAPQTQSIRRWCLHFFCLWSEFEEQSRYRWVDGITSQLAKNGSTISSFVVQTPCLCSCIPKGSYMERYTIEKWTMDIRPVLARLSPLPVGGTVNFVPCRQARLRPCPIRKCKALIDSLDDLANITESKTAANNEAPPEPRKELLNRKIAGESDNGWMESETTVYAQLYFIRTAKFS